MNNWKEFIFSDSTSFGVKAREVYRYQFDHNPVYRRFCEALGANEDALDYPLLPVRAFKEAEIVSNGSTGAELVFQSSGTEGMMRSRHPVVDPDIYRRSVVEGFRTYYRMDQSVVWGYLPEYSENPDSSLIRMVRELIAEDPSGLSRFLTPGQKIDEEAVREVKKSGRQLILFGAAFGLLDLLELQPDLWVPSNSIVIETGGMKTHRREMNREELHRRLADGFGLDGSRIHSEYGMCEMLSQAYATGGSWFKSVPWMKVTVRNPEDPAEELEPYEEGLIGIIDLANVYSCSFLFTGDRGMMHEDGRFRVMGRWNPKDLRGCNFLVDRD